MNTTLIAAIDENFPIQVREAIYARRATRHFLPEKVSENQVQALIESAIQAPSAMNLQPWAFAVIQKPDLLKRISSAAKELILQNIDFKNHPERGHVPLDNPNFDIFYDANTVIVIYVKQQDGFEPVGDCYLAAQNLMLAALEFNLATCPIGFARDVLREERWKKELSIPKGYEPVLPIAIGYSAITMPPTERTPAKILNWLHA